MKPEIQGSTTKREPLPKGNYTAIITGYRLVDRKKANTGNDKWDADEARYFELEREQFEKEQTEKANADSSYKVRDFPAHRQYKYWFDLQVVTGDHRGRYLPRKKTTTLLSTHDLNGLFKFLSEVPGAEGSYKNLKERIDAGDAPDFDEEVVGKCVDVTVTHNANGYPKITAFLPSSYKATAADIAEFVMKADVSESAAPKKDELEDDIPFHHLPYDSLGSTHCGHSRF